MAISGNGRKARRANPRNLADEFERLYREAYPLVYNYSYHVLLSRTTAEDITSEAFLKAARNFERFDETRAKFSTWVVAIARNCMTDFYRKSRPEAPLDDSIAVTLAAESSHEERLCNEDLVKQLLATLDPNERQLIFMKYYEGKGNVEIAEELAMNPSTLSTKLSRAVSKMRTAAKALGGPS